MRTSVFLISLVLVAYAQVSVAQSDPEEDSIQISVYADSSWYKTRFIPTGIRVGLDLVSFGQGVQKNGARAFTQGDVRQWKLNADVDFYRYFINFEFGIFDRLWVAPESFYQNKGTYFKIGPDVNFLQRDPDQSALFIGLRYARSNFKDRITFNYINDFWGTGSGTDENNNLTSRWFEITTGLKVKLYKLIWTGYTARFKFSVNNTHSSNDLVPLWIPGYGFAKEESQWGLEYYLIFRIPFKKFIPAPPKD